MVSAMSDVGESPCKWPPKPLPAAHVGGVGRKERPPPESTRPEVPASPKLRGPSLLMIAANLELAGRVIVSLQDLQDSAED